MADARTAHNHPRPTGRCSTGVALLTLASLFVAGGCATTPKQVADPVAVLSAPGKPARDYKAAMATADAAPDKEYTQALRRMIHLDGYVIDARRAAYARLREIDPDGLRDTLAVQLPRMDNLVWRKELCERIAADRWMEMTPTLIRAWAVPMRGEWSKLGKERPERIALVSLHGEDQIVAVLLAQMREANPITQANLRTRCWELLLLEGQEERLRSLLADETSIGQDAMMLDLRAAVVELGVLPRTREEILWIRALREPSRAAFWAQAKSATALLPESRRTALEVRDIPVVVAASLHRPELLTMGDAAMYEELVRAGGGPNRTVYSPNFQGHAGQFTERLYDVRNRLTWGDRAAMLIAYDAFAAPALTAHVFQAGDRDVADRASEHGGVIALDESGRFEFIEFPSRTRGNDARFESSQELMDELYTSLFHLHYHAQAYDNGRYAGPHIGDFQFADATGANCIVLSFLDSETLDVDFYRHDQIVVDLGTIKRP